MSETTKPAASRREFLQTSGRLATATALASMVVPKVHAAEDNTIRVALVGCGGRGTGAAADALSVTNGPIQLVAMADVFQKRLDDSFKNLNLEYSDRMDVSDDRKFVGFDGYQKAIDCLRPGDVAIFATPPAFRWVHFTQAIQKGVNVFMEKPVTVDGPTSRKMFALGEEAKKKNLKVGVGLMCRHCKARQELFDRIKSGEIGDITMLRAYRMHGPLATAFSTPKPTDDNELMWQIARFHSFLWASGGCYSDFLIHNIDECCWMKDAWPVQAQALGGRHYRGNNVDQNFDTYAVEYTFADGAKLWLDGRVMAGCHDKFSSYAHGTKGSATISESSHTPSRCKIFRNQNIQDHGGDVAWSFGRREPNPYREEWQDLIDAIRQDKPYNEVERGTAASLVTSMGRMAAHTGQVVTWDDILNCDHEFAPDVDKLTINGPAPIQANSEG
ncbi:MAG TPA: Gfo/Idh/MocA family oxidoreductase, partial [Pirellulales bacterium]|nr:Gfo/Idh/MocA family oxidoreductase [Pirellulales bacterium]